jgi:hypothetical protein
MVFFFFIAQVLALEQRLRVTEERLGQERADRASNLSQVEEKLLTENSKLQVQYILLNLFKTVYIIFLLCIPYSNQYLFFSRLCIISNHFILC